ncbi:hypothetical protein [Mariluticola halotolerans]|uniref:hypothetical protein n=1 Tax=Mariluticola halotolerans TaxID=2909283 RepID=UPI0026E1A915|nr:hypothetical protein [Mariluticola halotolerans]UJQ95889.1 hypothetical protein L1P08_07875 [Mariluticola halotolerans]
MSIQPFEGRPRRARTLYIFRILPRFARWVMARVRAYRRRRAQRIPEHLPNSLRKDVGLPLKPERLNAWDLMRW